VTLGVRESVPVPLLVPVSVDDTDPLEGDGVQDSVGDQLKDGAGLRVRVGVGLTVAPVGVKLVTVIPDSVIVLHEGLRDGVPVRDLDLV